MAPEHVQWISVAGLLTSACHLHPTSGESKCLFMTKTLRMYKYTKNINAYFCLLLAPWHKQWTVCMLIQTKPAWNGTCLKHETFTVPRIQTSSTCINWNKPAVKKKFDPLWFLHRHVSVFQVLVPQHNYWTQFAFLHLVLVPRHKYWTQFAFLHLVLVPRHK